MAEIFGSGELFDEFEKTRPSSDKILRQKFEAESPLRGVCRNYATNIVRDGGDRQVTGGPGAVSDCSQFPESETGTSQLTDDVKRNNFAGLTSLQYIRKLESELARLTTLNAQLLEQNRLINPNRYVQNGDGPAIQVLFMNHDIARSHRDDVESFLSELCQQRLHSVPSASHSQVVHKQPNFVQLGSQDEDMDEERARANLVVGSCKFYADFLIDTVGLPLTGRCWFLADMTQIPKYEQMFSEMLPCEDEDEIDAAAPPRNDRPSKSCFNCGGNHNLNACKEQVDHRRVGENRRQFKKKFLVAQNTPSRYHVEDDPRFAGMKPGVISTSLREALGISEHQLPLYIYKMRVCGYPPGHLENARTKTSGLSMFDKHGLEVKVDGELLEDGEVNEDRSPAVVTFDSAKLVDYPGFNIPPSPDIIDESRRLNLPPMQTHQQKDEMLRSLSFSKASPSIAGVKRQHGQPADDGVGHTKVSRTDAILSGEDMDLDDSVTTGDVEPPEPITAASDNLIGPASVTPARPRVTLPASQGSPAEVPSSSATASPLAVFTPVSSFSSVSFTLGTPIEADFSDESSPVSGVKKLPDRSRFAVGVSDHILYENLPNATGTFKRLCEVIKSMHEKTPPMTPPTTSSAH